MWMLMLMLWCDCVVCFVLCCNLLCVVLKLIYCVLFCFRRCKFVSRRNVLRFFILSFIVFSCLFFVFNVCLNDGNLFVCLLLMFVCVNSVCMCLMFLVFGEGVVVFFEVLLENV